MLCPVDMEGSVPCPLLPTSPSPKHQGLFAAAEQGIWEGRGISNPTRSGYFSLCHLYELSV